MSPPLFVARAASGSSSSHPPPRAHTHAVFLLPALRRGAQVAFRGGGASLSSEGMFDLIKKLDRSDAVIGAGTSVAGRAGLGGCGADGDGCTRFLRQRRTSSPHNARRSTPPPAAMLTNTTMGSPARSRGGAAGGEGCGAPPPVGGISGGAATALAQYCHGGGIRAVMDPSFVAMEDKLEGLRAMDEAREVRARARTRRPSHKSAGFT